MNRGKLERMSFENWGWIRGKQDIPDLAPLKFSENVPGGNNESISTKPEHKTGVR